MTVVVDPFFKKLYSRLAEELDKRIHVLASGSAKTHGADGNVDAVSTALKYFADVSYIEALQGIIDLGLEIDKEIYGTNKRTIDNDGD